MPEGPEYYVMADEIPALGKLSRWEQSVYLRDFISPAKLSCLKKGTQFNKPFAYGKSLWFPLVLPDRQNAVLLSQLGMTGGWFLDAAAERRGHAHLTFYFENGRRLRYSDPRRFGGMELYEYENLNQLKEKVRQQKRWGVDPLQATIKDVEVALAAARLRSRRAPIKSVMLDQKVVFGTGNYLASEILFAAKVHPLSPVSCLSDAELHELARSSIIIMKKACRLKGNSIDNGNYLRPDGERGKMWAAIAVYDKAGAPCKRCGARIERIVIAGRSTFFCPICQRKCA